MSTLINLLPIPFQDSEYVPEEMLSGLVENSDRIHFHFTTCSPEDEYEKQYKGLVLTRVDSSAQIQLNENALRQLIVSDFHVSKIKNLLF